MTKRNSKDGSLTGYKPSIHLIHWETKGIDNVWVEKGVIQTLRGQVLRCAWGDSGNRDKGSWYPPSTYYGLKCFTCIQAKQQSYKVGVISVIDRKVTQVRKVWYLAYLTACMKGTAGVGTLGWFGSRACVLSTEPCSTSSWHRCTCLSREKSTAASWAVNPGALASEEAQPRGQELWRHTSGFEPQLPNFPAVWPWTILYLLWPLVFSLIKQK